MYKPPFKLRLFCAYFLGDGHDRSAGDKGISWLWVQTQYLGEAARTAKGFHCPTATRALPVCEALRGPEPGRWRQGVREPCWRRETLPGPRGGQRGLLTAAHVPNASPGPPADHPAGVCLVPWSLAGSRPAFPRGQLSYSRPSDGPPNTCKPKGSRLGLWKRRWPPPYTVSLLGEGLEWSQPKRTPETGWWLVSFCWTSVGRKQNSRGRKGRKQVSWPVRLWIFKNACHLLGILSGSGNRAVKFLSLRRRKIGREAGRQGQVLA